MSPRAERLFRQAESARERNELSAARDLLEEAIRWAPHGNLYLAYAEIAEQGSTTEHAISVIQCGLKRFSHAIPLYRHASLLVLRGRPEQAEVTLRPGSRRNADAAVLHRALASLLVDIGNKRDFDRAARHARGAKRLGFAEALIVPFRRTPARVCLSIRTRILNTSGRPLP
jgi:predicted Zn-dependent protease